MENQDELRRQVELWRKKWKQTHDWIADRVGITRHGYYKWRVGETKRMKRDPERELLHLIQMTPDQWHPSVVKESKGYYPGTLLAYAELPSRERTETLLKKALDAKNLEAIREIIEIQNDLMAMSLKAQAHRARLDHLAKDLD